MNLIFKEIESSDIKNINTFFELRSNKTCDSIFLDVFLWKDYYKVRFAVWEQKALFLTMKIDGELYCTMPMCLEKDLPSAFDVLLDYFNTVLNKKLKVFLADQQSLDILSIYQNYNSKNNNIFFNIFEVEDAKDYIYSAEALKLLSGKKLRKKKNHINAFLREYDKRFYYKQLCCCNNQEIVDFLEEWKVQKNNEAKELKELEDSKELGDNKELKELEALKDSKKLESTKELEDSKKLEINKQDKQDENYLESHLDGELTGILQILQNCKLLKIIMAGIYIDDKLQAFTIGSYNQKEKMAIIHIEKANASIRGLYPYINQQFIINDFPEAEIVNREDDLGIEGLRKAKLSYEPIDYARKFRVEQT